MIIKPKISIDIIGKGRFYIGLSISVTILVIYGLREFFKPFLSVTGFKLEILSSSDYLKFLFLHSLNIAALCMSLMIVIWFLGQSNISIKFRNKNRLTMTNIFLLNFTVLFFLNKLITFYITNTGLFELKILFLIGGLTSFLIFMNSWNNINLIFKTVKWRLISFGVMFLYAAILTGLVWFNIP